MMCIYRKNIYLHKLNGQPRKKMLENRIYIFQILGTCKKCLSGLNGALGVGMLNYFLQNNILD